MFRLGLTDLQALFPLDVRTHSQVSTSQARALPLRHSQTIHLFLGIGGLDAISREQIRGSARVLEGQAVRYRRLRQEWVEGRRGEE
jgi:hypothetical protein